MKVGQHQGILVHRYTFCALFWPAVHDKVPVHTSALCFDVLSLGKYCLQAPDTDIWEFHSVSGRRTNLYKDSMIELEYEIFNLCFGMTYNAS